jgi:predicted RNase H-like HicB family nuclease
MENNLLALTAVYIKLGAEYVGFIEELPGMNARGRTLFEARTALQNLAAETFAEERRTVEEAHGGGSMVREAFFLPARAARKTA